MKKKLLLIISIISVLFIYTNVYAEDGWVTENGNTYYYENNEKVSGFKEIDGKLYFFSRNDYSLKKGWLAAYGEKWYQNENGEVLRGIQTINNNTYYFNNEGFLRNGFITVDGKIYFFSRNDNTLKKGWLAAYGKRWYQNENGELVTGIQTIDNEKYYFDEEGFLSGGFVKEEEKIYFFSRNDFTLKHGWVAAYGKRWYQNENGELVTGIQTIDNVKYYFNEEGFLSGGFVKDDGKIYFFSRNDYSLKKGWQAAYGERWYQNNEGELVTGIQTIGKDKYYFNEEGFLRNGFITIDGNIYFFSRLDNTLKKGWQASDATTIWYQDDNGILIKGHHNIDGREYFFNEETGLLDGFRKENNKTYYYDPDGTLNKGIQYIGNRFLKFDSTTGAFEKIVRQIRVIDISTHNGVIDWNKVKASNQVDGVILRLGYGQGYMDSRFLYNKSELERLGIPYSVYLFSYAENKTEAQKEADFVVRTIQNEAVKIASSIFAVYYDLEDWEIKSTGENSYGISQDTYGQMITTFVNTIENNLGVRGRVYASKNYIETRFPAYARDYATWVAQWNDTITYKGNYEGWQYTSTGSVPGINGNVDMNIFYY